ncbi:MAG: type II toxin-antitoxin system Phd/YefM family antitoxin [Betaproteobacteria bacterium]|nr:type II toxin-antitoxin system Phd/YefM family antitoxin [Betaproteobacteria bacterium]
MPIRTVNIHEAKTHLSELLALVLAGEEVVIAKANKPVARLVPLVSPRKQRVFGLHRGEFWVSNDFDEPLADEFWLGNGPI